MTSPNDIANLALSQIGARAKVASPVPFASDGSQAGDEICLQYQVRFDALARSANWNCLRRQAVLTLKKAAIGTLENTSGLLPQPPQPWLYEYGLPPDYIKGRFIPEILQLSPVTPPFMSGPAFMPPPVARRRMAIPFAIAIDTDEEGNEERVLLSNWRNAQLVYTARVNNPDLWDTQFTTAFVATLSAFLVNPLNRDAQLASEQANIAKSLINDARISDGNEGPSSADHLPDFIAARAGGVWEDDEFFMSPWESMALPGMAPV